MLAQTAYSATAPVRTSRATEYAAFQKVTARLVRAGREDAPVRERAEALYDNRRLWSVLAADLASDVNGLPDALRARLVSLAVFSLEQSARALRDPAALQPLVEVNTAVMRGLSGDGASS
jgi:flagellar protein FlaF